MLILNILWVKGGNQPFELSHLKKRVPYLLSSISEDNIELYEIFVNSIAITTMVYQDLWITKYIITN